MSVDYKSTLQLPATKFPMRAGLAKREPETVKFWEDNQIYKKMVESNKDHHSFMFHDGPPYANGEIHIGHALNKSLKDFIVKYKSMRGYYCPYVPGWDTHGLPIELKTLKSEEIDKDNINPLELRQHCATYAKKYVDIQRKGMIRLGCFADWEHPYLTLQHDFEARELGTLASMVEKGLIYRGTKPVYWCIDCQTALAAAEIEYADETSPSVFVAYQLDDVSDKYPQLKGKDVNVIVWTTTPWTLPASMAIAIHPSYPYAFYEVGDKVYLIAEGMADSVSADTGIQFGEPLLTVQGHELELLNANHPFYDRKTPILLADYVTLDAGTGCVHTAPGHGVEDYETGCRYNIENYNPVDAKGYFVPETPLVGGMSIDEGAKVCLNVLTENGRLLGLKKISHSYPHCWRCHKPVIFRSTPQWFIDVSAFRDRSLDVINNEVRWIPAWGHDRIFNMVRDRSDWCISRQRVWGVPIPAFECPDCRKTVLSADRIRKVQEWVAKEGCDAWWAHSTEELLGDLNVCPYCGGKHLEKGKDILDVWFDSGVSHFSVMDTRPELSWPADLYLEGSDQHRGWFQTSLLASVAVSDKAP
ncbi:MAG: isoleucine--tRNA ligase, partial [Pyramidobacter sp.]|nr:isoleucine--tRNA ligase [Pyramidobacter sp.]